MNTRSGLKFRLQARPGSHVRQKSSTVAPVCLSRSVMSRMVSRNPIKRKWEEKRLAKLQKQGRLVKGIEIPEHSLATNPDAQEHHGGYSAKFYYQDTHYTCAGCGKPEVWTAQQQKRYFEVQKGNTYNESKWCYRCHSKRMKEKDAKNDKA